MAAPFVFFFSSSTYNQESRSYKLQMVKQNTGRLGVLYIINGDQWYYKVTTSVFESLLYIHFYGKILLLIFYIYCLQSNAILNWYSFCLKCQSSIPSGLYFSLFLSSFISLMEVKSSPIWWRYHERSFSTNISCFHCRMTY